MRCPRSGSGDNCYDALPESTAIHEVEFGLSSATAALGEMVQLYTIGTIG